MYTRFLAAIKWASFNYFRSHSKWLSYSVGQVEEALRLEGDTFKERYGVAKPKQDTDIIFHCRAGVRSLTAMESANKLGYSRFDFVYATELYRTLCKWLSSTTGMRYVPSNLRARDSFG